MDEDSLIDSIIAAANDRRRLDVLSLAQQWCALYSNEDPLDDSRSIESLLDDYDSFSD